MFVNKNKIIVVVLLAFEKNDVIICVAWQRSSVVEQRNHNPLVGGPNPSAATKIQTARVAVFYLYYDLGPVVHTSLKLRATRQATG